MKLNSFKKKLIDTLFGSRKGLSILLAIILVTVIMLFAVGVASDVIESSRHANNVKEGTVAYYNAESALEMGLLVNKLLKEQGKAIGADLVKNLEISELKGPDGQPLPLNFKVHGTAERMNEKKVNGNYIIPLPWTGDVPWTGEGSVSGVGGCDFQKPPKRSGAKEGKNFKFNYVGSGGGGVQEGSADEKDHPCNWNRLRVGEKATIPLYYLDENEDKVNFKEFKLRLRTPCAYGNEMCPTGANQRMELNCFDKGDEEVICGDSVNFANIIMQRGYGEVLVTWQIDAKDENGNLVSLMPNEKDGGFIPYDLNVDSQLFEGLLNVVKDNFDYGALNQDKLGKLINGDVPMRIVKFLSEEKYKEPVLKLSVVGDLMGCKNEISCNYQNDFIESENYEMKRIPYIEYQVDFGNQHFPLSPTNIITAEGQYGQFTQTIQIKAPHTDTGLEYVIQQ